MKKIKMKDIAEQANVSIATVSYILNNVENQKISGETRDRVLEACKTMGYLPNLAARTLASKKSGLIGVLHVKDSSVQNPWQDFIYCRFLDEIEMILSQQGYHTLYVNVDLNHPEMNVVLQRELDGVILLDVCEDIFYQISDVFTVPIIIVDGFLNDSLFHKIVLDYQDAMDKAKNALQSQPEFVISIGGNNKGVAEKIAECAAIGEQHLCFARTEVELEGFLKRHLGKKGIIFNEFIALFALRYFNPNDFVTVCTSDSPDILPNNIKKVMYRDKKPQIAAELMLSFLKEVYSDINNKYTVIHY